MTDPGLLPLSYAQPQPHIRPLWKWQGACKILAVRFWCGSRWTQAGFPPVLKQTRGLNCLCVDYFVYLCSSWRWFRDVLLHRRTKGRHDGGVEGKGWRQRSNKILTQKICLVFVWDVIILLLPKNYSLFFSSRRVVFYLRAKTCRN